MLNGYRNGVLPGSPTGKTGSRESEKEKLSKQGYVCLVKAEAQRISSVASELKNLEKRPASGIEVQGAWETFGAHDAVVVFIADSPQHAMEFITRNISNFEGIRSTETLTGQPLPSFTPGASA